MYSFSYVKIIGQLLLTTLLCPIIDFVILVGEGIVMWSLLDSCALETSGARDWLPLDALHTIQYRTLQSRKQQDDAKLTQMSRAQSLISVSHNQEL